MPSFELLMFGGVFLLIVATGLALLVVLRASRSRPAVAAFESGRFADALELATTSATGSEELLAGVRAARHLLDFDTAIRLLNRLSAEDPEEGEVWLERGLCAACARQPEIARQAFDRAARLRADLLESISLHRAWLELVQGDRKMAHRLFDEIEMPVRNKLDTDLGDGDPAFSEWFMHAGQLWQSRGVDERARRAFASARKAAPESLLPDLLESWEESSQVS